MRKYLAQFIGLAGLAVCLIGLSSMIGYFKQVVYLYQWGDGVPMAINTATGFFITGLALLATGKGIAEIKG